MGKTTFVFSAAIFAALAASADGADFPHATSGTPPLAYSAWFFDDGFNSYMFEYNCWGEGSSGMSYKQPRMLDRPIGADPYEVSPSIGRSRDPKVRPYQPRVGTSGRRRK